MQEIFTKLYILFVMNTINVTQNFIVRRMSVSKDRSDFNRQIMPIQLVKEINTSQTLQENIRKTRIC
jgi:hypothetical protein